MTKATHSSQLQFTRDGRTLVVPEADAVSLVDVRGDGRRRITIPGVQAVAAFADQIWVATRTGALVRFASDGRLLDEYVLPIDPDAVLIPTTIGSPAALWTGREPLPRGGVASLVVSSWLALAMRDPILPSMDSDGPLDQAPRQAARRALRRAGVEGS